MLNPELYTKGNAVQRRDAKELISEYIDLVHWRGTDDETALDVGCGSGDVTWDLLKPRLPPTVRISGADIAQDMLSYAAETYPEINFFRLDIGEKDIPKYLYTAFDHIFSFYCLHWVRDQRQVMQNIFNMLKPGGDLFTYYVAHNNVLDVATFNSFKLTKWSDYLRDDDESYPIYKFEDYFEEGLKKILIDVGFTISVCKVITRQFMFSSINMLKSSLAAVNPCIAKIPNELKDEFINDSLQELLKLKDVKENKCEDSNQVTIAYTLVVIVASKRN